MAEENVRCYFSPAFFCFYHLCHIASISFHEEKSSKNVGRFGFHLKKTNMWNLFRLYDIRLLLFQHILTLGESDKAKTLFTLSYVIILTFSLLVLQEGINYQRCRCDFLQACWRMITVKYWSISLQSILDLKIKYFKTSGG